MRDVPRLCEFYPGICPTTEEKATKNLSQGKKNLSQVKKNLSQSTVYIAINPLNAELNSICHLLALLGAHPILHVSRIRVKIRKNYIYCVFGGCYKQLVYFVTH